MELNYCKNWEYLTALITDTSVPRLKLCMKLEIIHWSGHRKLSFINWLQ